MFTLIQRIFGVLIVAVFAVLVSVVLLKYFLLPPLTGMKPEALTVYSISLAYGLGAAAGWLQWRHYQKGDARAALAEGAVLRSAGTAYDTPRPTRIGAEIGAPWGEPTSLVHPAMAQRITAMLSHRSLFEQRARDWIASPAFDEVFDQLHKGLMIKLRLMLMGKGRAMKLNTSGLWKNYMRLITEGELLFGPVVIGNTGMSDNLQRRVPAAVLASRRQDAASLQLAAALADEIGMAYVMEGSREMPACSKIIADDEYQALRQRPLPIQETQGLPAALFDIRVSYNELMCDTEPSPFVPLMVHPKTGVFVVVPWPILLGKTMPMRKAAA